MHGLEPGAAREEEAGHRQPIGGGRGCHVSSNQASPSPQLPTPSTLRPQQPIRAENIAGAIRRGLRLKRKPLLPAGALANHALSPVCTFDRIIMHFRGLLRL